MKDLPSDLKEIKMNKLGFNKFLLKVAFSCMACDEEIDKRELLQIKRMHEDEKIFGEIDIDKELEQLFESISRNSLEFLRGFFSDLSSRNFTVDEELQIIKTAVNTIKADKKVVYSEVKFFKVIRGNLSIDNESIINLYPDFEEYLEQDVIGDTYLSRLQDDVFNDYDSNDFKLKGNLDINDMIA